jgi:hypothetical protein|tara:strand:+ start:315 stop:581 length:267 start_codon:yes stop_codon:yes gene_type:complete
MSYLAIGRLILAGVSKSKIISKYSKKAYDAVKKQIKELDKLDKIQGNKPSTKVLAGVGVVNLAAMAGVSAIDKKKKNKNPRLKVKKKK